MNFKRIRRSSLSIKWMRDHPIFARAYAFTVIFWGPFVMTANIIWEERKEYKRLYEDILGVIFMEDDIDDLKN